MIDTPRMMTTEMEVTSIRLERDLKERLKQIADEQGTRYQALLRAVLWNFVDKHQGATATLIAVDLGNGVAVADLICAVSGENIPIGAPVNCQVTNAGTIVFTKS